MPPPTPPPADRDSGSAERAKRIPGRTRPAIFPEGYVKTPPSL